MANRWGKQWKQWQTLFLGLQNHYGQWLQPWISKTLAPWKKSYDKPREHIKKQRHYLADKGPFSQSFGFSSSHVWMWEFDHNEGWALKNRCLWTVVLEKTLAIPLDWKDIKPVNPKGNQTWIFFGRTDAEAEAPTLWPPVARDQLIRQDPDAGKDLRQEKGKRITEDEMVEWHHRLNRHEQTMGDGEGQASLACCSHEFTKSWTWLCN